MGTVDKDEAGHREQTVEHQQLITEMIAPPDGSEMVEQGAGKRSQKADDGREAVRHATLCEEAEGEEAEQRAVGVARHGVDDIDGAATAQQTEREDGDDERHDDGHVDPSAQADIRGAAEDVAQLRGCQRGYL